MDTEIVTNRYSGQCPITRKTETIAVDCCPVNISNSLSSNYKIIAFECPVEEDCTYRYDNSCPILSTVPKFQ